MTENNLIYDFETGLYFQKIPVNCIYTRNDLKWINSGTYGYTDKQGNYAYWGKRIIKGNVYYQKIYSNDQQALQSIYC